MASRSNSLSACSAWATHSHPASVDNAYWKGLWRAWQSHKTVEPWCVRPTVEQRHRPQFPWLHLLASEAQSSSSSGTLLQRSVEHSDIRSPILVTINVTVCDCHVNPRLPLPDGAPSVVACDIRWRARRSSQEMHHDNRCQFHLAHGCASPKTSSRRSTEDQICLVWPEGHCCPTETLLRTWVRGFAHTHTTKSSLRECPAHGPSHGAMTCPQWLPQETMISASFSAAWFCRDVSSNTCPWHGLGFFRSWQFFSFFNNYFAWFFSTSVFWWCFLTSPQARRGWKEPKWKRHCFFSSFGRGLVILNKSGCPMTLLPFLGLPFARVRYYLHGLFWGPLPPAPLDLPKCHAHPEPWTTLNPKQHQTLNNPKTTIAESWTLNYADCPKVLRSSPLLARPRSEPDLCKSTRGLFQLRSLGLPGFAGPRWACWAGRACWRGSGDRSDSVCQAFEGLLLLCCPFLALLLFGVFATAFVAFASSFAALLHSLLRCWFLRSCISFCV